MVRSSPIPLFLCLVGSALAAIPVVAQPASCNAVVGVWPLGPSYAVALDGTTALLGRGRELTLVNVATPNVSPLPIVGRVTLPGQVRKIALSGTVPGLAAVAMDAEGVALVDYSTPSAPVMTHHFAVGGPAYGLAFGPTDGGLFLPPVERLFVARGLGGIQIVEYDNPGGPVLRGSFVHGSPHQSNSVDVVVERFDLGFPNYAYRAFVADQNTGVTALDVASADSPFLAGGPYVLSGPAGARTLLLHRDPALPAAQADRLFVGAGTSGLRAFNILSGTISSQYTLTLPNAPFDVEDLSRDGMRLFLAASYGGMRVVDITDLGSMSQLATSGSTLGRAHGVAASPTGYAYLAGEQGGLLVYQIQTGPPMTTTWRNTLLTTGTAYDAAGTDRFAYVADFSYGLDIVDLLAPGGPTLVSPPASFFFQGTSVALAGPLAIVGDFSGFVRVLDVSDPAAPIELGAVFVTAASISSIAVAGTRAYVSTSYGQLFAVVDFSASATPVVQDTVALGFTSEGVALAGSYAYVASSNTPQLAVIDISDPGNLVLANTVSTGFNAASDVAVGGGVGLLARGSELVTLDLSTPTAPGELGGAVVATGASTASVASTAGYAHLVGIAVDAASGGAIGRAFAVDVQTPATPVTVGSIRVPGPRAIAPAGDRLMIASGDLGVTVITDCTILLRDGFEDGVALPGRWSAYVGP